MIDLFGFDCPDCKTSVGIMATGYLKWLCLLCGNTFEEEEGDEI